MTIATKERREHKGVTDSVLRLASAPASWTAVAERSADTAFGLRTVSTLPQQYGASATYSSMCSLCSLAANPFSP